MRFNPYDDVMHSSLPASSVAIHSLTGSTEVDTDGVDTAQVFIAESILLHIRNEIASGTPDAATMTWALQESDTNGSWEAATDNTGAAITGVIDAHTVATDTYVRIEGINLQAPGDADAAIPGGRARWLRVTLTPAFTNGSSPAILAYAELIGVPGSGQQLPVRTAVSNT